MAGFTQHSQRPLRGATRNTYHASLPAQNWLLSAIHLWGLILLTLHLAAAKLPEETSWALWPYTFLPPWLGWTLALLAGALIIPAMSQPIKHLSSFVFRPSSFFSHASRLTPQLWFILAALFSGLLFWLARLRHLREPGHCAPHDGQQ